MKRLVSLSPVLVLTLTSIGLADPVIVGPKQVDPYKIVDLTVSGAGTEDLVFWDVAEESLADIREKGHNLTFTGPPGLYHIKARVVPVKDGKITGDQSTLRTTVTIGTPTPPAPPVPPMPTDPLAVAVQAAWAQETDPAKVSQLSQLSGLYRQMALQLPTADVNTIADLQVKFSQAELGLGITPTMLPHIRPVTSAYLKDQIGTTPTASVDKTRAAAAFQKLADITGGLR